MVNCERLVSNFVSLASLYSPSYNERFTADEVIIRLKALGLNPTEDNAGETINGNTGNIFTEITGDRDDSPRLFSAHLDTVIPCENKKILVGDIITSDGTTILGADDFAAVACILEALEVIKENNLSHGPIELLFIPAEEMYSKGANAFDFSKIKSKVAFTPDYDGALGLAVNKAPTIISFCAQMQGKASHAGFAPEMGESAIMAVASAIAGQSWGRLDAETTANIGIIRGGVSTNIVPEKCIVNGEIRSYSHEKALDKLARIRKSFIREGDCNFTHEICIRAYETPKSSRAVSIYKKVCQKINIDMSLVSSFGGSDNNTFSEKGIDGLVIASAMHKCHTTSEFTTINELIKLCELIINLIIIEDLEVER